MTVEEWVRFSVVKIAKGGDGKPDYQGPKTLIYAVELPRWLWIHRQPALDWIRHRFCYLNPFDTLSTGLYFFDKKTGLDVGLNSAVSRVSSAKAQVTKTERQMAEYVAGFRPTLFIATAQETDAYKNALEKLNRKRAELFQAEQDLEAERQNLQLT